MYSLRKINTNHVSPKVYFSCPDIIRPNCQDQSELLHQDHGPHHHSDDSKEIKIHSKWLDWTWTLGQLFQQLENEVVSMAIDKLRSKISGKFDAEVLLHELETMTKEAKELAKEVPFNHWIFTSPSAMIGATLVCLFMQFCSWQICRNNGPAAAPVPYLTTPPAPPTVFNITVDSICR
jgi:hypothetical protein